MTLDSSIEHQLGEHDATLNYIICKIDSIETKVDAIQMELAESRGGKKVAGLLWGLIGGIISAAGTVCAIILGFGGLRL